MRMLLLCGSFWLLTAGGAAAFTSLPVVSSSSYEPHVVTSPVTAKRVYLGTLEGFPDMYEIASPEPFTLDLALSTLVDSPVKPALSVIIVEAGVSGVTEVSRINHDAENWQLKRESITGLSLLAGPEYQSELAAGTYWIEISTPDNNGQYLLTLGHQPLDTGYFATLQSIAQTYEFVGQSKWRMIRSPYVYWPLSSGLIICLLIVIWRERKRIWA